MAAAAVLWGLVDGGRMVFLLPGGHLSRASLIGAAVGAGLGLAVVGLSRLSMGFLWAKRLHMEFHTLLSGLTLGQAFVLAAASAVGEEALFRGAMVPTLGLWWSSALFAVSHAPVRRGLWPWPIMAFGMGLVFAVLFEKYGDLSGPILAHFTINFLNLKYIADHRFPEVGPESESESEPESESESEPEPEPELAPEPPGAPDSSDPDGNGDPPPG